MARLRVLKDGVELQNLDLAVCGKSSLSLGRADGADIKLDDRAIGREHAVFLISSNGITIQKKSKFGKLSVNGAETAESVVKVGDVINIADYQVRVEEGTAAVVSAPTPNISNEVTPPGGTVVPALADAPDVASMAEGDTPGLGIAAPDGAAPPGMDGIVAVDTAEAPDALAMEQPMLEAPLDSSISVDAAAGIGDQPTGGIVDQGFAAEGGDRTAMISTSAVTTKLVFKPGEANTEEFVIKKGEISLGRGTTCDIVLADKKSSRKHLIIKRVGMNFVAQDLGSANGTYVNDQKIAEQELAGDDVLRIGDTEFTFKAISQEYMQQEQAQEFISPPPEEAPPDEDFNGGMPAVGGDSPHNGSAFDPSIGLGGGMGGGMAGMDGPPAEKPPSSPIGKAIFFGKIWFKKQKKPVQIAVVGIAALTFAYGLGLMDEPEKPKVVKKVEKVVSKDPMDIAFAALPEEKKQFVTNTYQLGMDLYKQKEYDKSLYEIEKLLEVLPGGYKDALDVKKYAKTAIETRNSIDAELRAKEAAERLRKDLQELVTQAEAAVNAGKDSEAKDLFARILEKDPENPTILRLRQTLEERAQAAAAAEAAAKEKEFKKKQLEGTLKEGQDLLAAGKFYEVIEKMGDALPVFADDPTMTKQAKEMIETAKSTLKANTLPHLDKAKSLFDSGEFLPAREEYYQALKVDSRNWPAREGLGKIKEVLHERSRRIYIDAAVAEGVSDYRTAKVKYKECLDQAMREDSYYGMCSRKYKRFELVDRSTASSVTPTSPNSDPAPPKLPAPVLDAPAPPADDPEPPALPSDGAKSSDAKGSESKSSDAKAPDKSPEAPKEEAKF